MSTPKDPRSDGSSKASSIPVVDFKATLSPDDRIIVVMGPTGAGKSTFIDYATQQNGGTIGHDIISETSVIRAVRAYHPDDQGAVIFVDTPGFDDTNQSDFEILSQIADWFVKAYGEKVPISAIIHLHRISDNRITGSTKKNLQMFASMCGQTAMPRVILGTTMWSETKLDTAESREKRLIESFWADMIKEGCTVHRFSDSYVSAWQIIGKLPMEQETVLLARELCDDKKRLNETAAGVKLTEELNRLLADQKKAAALMEKRTADSQSNPALVAEIQQEHAELTKKIGGVVTQLQKLKVPFGRRIRNFFVGKKPRAPGLYVPSMEDVSL